jgi:hypothetical protein
MAVRRVYKSAQHDRTYFTQRESLVKGKKQYSLSTCANCSDQLLLIVKIFLKKTSYLNEEVNCTEPSASVRLSCFAKIKNLIARDNNSRV